MTTHHDVTFTSHGLTLSGTVTMPESGGLRPAVLLIVGSGMVDRDENAPKLPIDVMRQVALRLAEHGIASLRYDKRGVGRSEGDFWPTGLSDNVDDAAAALGCLRAQPGIDPDRVFACGHSEGATIAIQLAGRGEPLAGAILLAGVGRRGEDALLWQGEKVVPGMPMLVRLLIGAFRVDVRAQQVKAFAKLKRSTKDTYRVQVISKVNAKWMREFLTYDPTEDLRRITVPVLAVTGAKDIQVDPADLDVMASLVPGPFESHVVPDVTHLLRADDSPVPSIRTYKAQIAQPVDERVLSLVTGWLRRQTTPTRQEADAQPVVGTVTQDEVQHA